ncbi:YveK family protein [Desertibacillus haloalkaliphilus]|uniref:YveK family protein n=1 Tax=Desertibacillus haloalkaliphilus TaxID=1328930 RepID=UPI001C274727|nr:Wzz/FepE/Etk N-terminal domain-containing protein [Desertibacillus haloalkaliphilus]MBU8906564.1 capsular biosynthesis protein [Desertibacillus haloalkaliphilus]
MEETISLKEIFETLKKRIVMIILITVMAVGASGVISYFFLTPMYQTSTQILVSQQATGASSALQSVGFDTDSKYIDTYNVIMKSPYILDQVIEELQLDRSHNALNNQLNVSQEGQSQVVSIRVEDQDPAMAVDIANTTAMVFQREVASLLRVDNVVVLAQAELSETPSPVSPNPPLNMAIGFVVGLMAAVGLAFLLEFLDNTVRTEKDIEDLLGLPVLGTIPVMDGDVNMKGNNQSAKNAKKMRGERVGS